MNLAGRLVRFSAFRELAAALHTPLAKIYGLLEIAIRLIVESLPLLTILCEHEKRFGALSTFLGGKCLQISSFCNFHITIFSNIVISKLHLSAFLSEQEGTYDMLDQRDSFDANMNENWENLES